MVSTSAWNAGGPWFDSQARHDLLLYANYACLYIYIYTVQSHNNAPHYNAVFNITRP